MKTNEANNNHRKLSYLPSTSTVLNYPFNIDLIPKVIRKVTKCSPETTSQCDSNKKTAATTTTNKTSTNPIVIKQICASNALNPIKIRQFTCTNLNTNKNQEQSFETGNRLIFIFFQLKLFSFFFYKKNFILSTTKKNLKVISKKVVIQILPEQSTPVGEEAISVGGELGNQIVLNPRPEDPLPHCPTKNIVLNWEKRKCCEIKTNLKNLGIEQVDPKEYKKKYGTTLVHTEKLPELAQQVKNEHGIQLAADYGKYFNSLEGDVHALTMVDLDKEGLSEYKHLVDDSLKQLQQEIRN